MLEFEDKILLHIPKCGGTSILTALKLDVWSGDDAYNKKYNVKIVYDDFYQTHIPASRVLTRKKKYAFVRNPWDRTVSRYYYCKKRYKITESFEDFVKNKIVKVRYDFGPPSWRQQVEWIDPGTVCMRVEDGIQTQLKHHFDLDIDIPVINSMNIDSYKSVYNQELYDIVSDYYKDDILYFNYK